MGMKRRLRSEKRGGVTRDVYDRHNQHPRQTWPEIKRHTPKERPIAGYLLDMGRG